MSTTRDVVLVLVGAGGTALTGVITSLVRARVERRAARRARVAAQIDEHLALYADYLLAVDDLMSALNDSVDDLIIPPIGSESQKLHAAEMNARREHERLDQQVSLVVPDDVADSYHALHEALANFYEWAHGEDLTEEGSKEYQALVTERVQDFVNALRVTYWKYEEAI